MSATVTIVAVEVSGSVVEVEASVTALGFDSTNYTLDISDTETGVSERYSDTIAPGAENIHRLVFDHGGADGGLITAQFTRPESLVGEQDQESWSAEPAFDPGAVSIVDCSLSSTEYEQGESGGIEYVVSNDNPQNAQFEYSVTVDGQQRGSGASTIFAGSENTFVAGFDTTGLSGSNIPVSIELTDAEEA